jgi:putative Holliday junction resolvase
VSQTLLGFDYGTKRIGVAVGQEITRTVTPLTTLRCSNETPDWKAISKLIEEWKPDKLVVGLPLHLDGTTQALTDRAQRFGNQLKGRYNLPVEMVDERLTSHEAETELATRKGKSTKTDIDALAAALILQSWLDQHRNE